MTRKPWRCCLISPDINTNPMSDTLPDDYIERVTSRDTRFAIIAQALAVENDLSTNPTIRTLMDAVRTDADQAMRDIVEISPADVAQIAFHQMRIKTLTYIRDVLDTLMRRGELAEHDIRQEDLNG